MRDDAKPTPTRAEVKALLSDRRFLVQFAFTYGDHLPQCEARLAPGPMAGERCTCGFVQDVAVVEKIEDAPPL